MKERIIELIKSGAIYKGMGIRELKTVLGPPKEVGGESRKYRMPCIFLYGEVQFLFSPAKSNVETENQRLEYVLIEDETSEDPEPFFLLN